MEEGRVLRVHGVLDEASPVEKKNDDDKWGRVVSRELIAASG